MERDTPDDFAGLIRTLDHGKVNEVLSEMLQRVVQGVEDTHMPGELTVKLTIEQKGQHAKVAAKVDQKVPHEPLNSSLFYFDLRVPGRLRRDNPKQLKLGVIKPEQESENHDG